MAPQSLAPAPTPHSRPSRWHEQFDLFSRLAPMFPSLARLIALHRKNALIQGGGCRNRVFTMCADKAYMVVTSTSDGGKRAPMLSSAQLVNVCRRTSGLGHGASPTDAQAMFND